MNVSDLGEFGLIERLARALPEAREPRLIVGIGDDAAVWRAADAYVIATTDTMVAGVHFLPDAAGWRDIGWKTLASNISDIAAMGGAPSFALVTLCLPPHTLVDRLDALYAGIDDCAREYGITVAGGDIVSSPTCTITIALYGEALVGAGDEPLLLRRDAARPGDTIAVTGRLGGAAGGLRALLDDNVASDGARALVARHMRPHPRVDAGQAAVRAGVRCGMDISDGLLQDLGHICNASGAAAEIELHDLPLEDGLLRAYPDDARAMAATGGEDYELILVAPDGVLARVDTPLTVIGRVVDDPAHRVRLLDERGAEVSLPHAGFDHLSRKSQPS